VREVCYKGWVSVPAVFSRILEHGFPGCRITSVCELGGGVSARAARIDLLLADGSARRVVVRRPRGASAGDIGLSAEHALLARCKGLGIAVPEPYFVDEREGAIVVEYVEGDVDLSLAGLAEKLPEMAQELARIHQVPASGELGSLESRRQRAERDVLEVPTQLDAALNEAAVRARLRELWPWRQPNPEVLLHGDYWPGNLVWREGRLVAVIDWEDAAVGDPLADLAIARLDVLWAFGEDAMLSFTESYRSRTRIDWAVLPQWDLWAALRPMSRLALWAPAYATASLSRPDISEATMQQGHQRFVEQALSASR